MYIRTKRNKSGTISVVVVDKSSGKYREIETIGIAKDEGQVEDLTARGRQWIADYQERFHPTFDFDCRAEAARERERRMPSLEQIQELKNNCTTERTTVNGVNGCLFTSNINGASLFLPAAGCRWGSELYDAGSNGYYWSRTLNGSYPYGAYCLYFSSGNVDWNDDWRYRYYGRSVRAVRVSQN